METRTLAPSQKLGFGKHADKTAAWVSKNYPGYLRYLEGNGLRIEISPAPATDRHNDHDNHNYREGDDMIYPGDDDPNGDEELYWRGVIGK